MSYFPMMVKLDGKKVLVIGGGEEGLKKTKILHDFGAEICLISKDALKEAAKLGYTKAIVPKSNYNKELEKLGVDIIYVSTIRDALDKI